MATKQSRQFLLGILGFVLVTGLSACVYAPPHPHHTHYHPHDYYYYPSVRVYFRYSTGYYYHPSGTVWVKTRKLPPRYRLDQRDRVVIRIEKDKPYTSHHQHREKYRPHPDYRPDPYRDEKERYYNNKRYDEYKKRQ